jgi:hypothetical protein
MGGPLLRRVLTACLLLLALLLLLACVAVLPTLLVPGHDGAALATLNEKDRLDALDGRLKLQNDVRTTLLQGLGGGLLVIGVLLTWKQIQISHDSQIADRYTRAVDQLSHRDMDVRTGGIYALGRIAADSPPEARPVLDVLSAYIRRHSPHKRHPDDGPFEAGLPLPAADIQAAMSVVGRRPADPRSSIGHRWRLDLHAADLRAVRLDGDFQGVVLAEAVLEQATLIKAEFWSAVLTGASLRGAIVGACSFQGADLREANLEGLQIIGKVKAGAVTERYGPSNFAKADLRGARLHDADLREAANLDKANLDGAEANPRTLWPAGLRWRELGVKVHSDQRP